MAETLELLKAEAIDQIRADLEATVAEDAQTASDAVSQTGADRAAAEAAALNAATYRDAAEDAVQYDYLVADDAARGAITGMVSGERAYIRSTEHVWLYNGSAWVDQGLSVTSVKADKAYVDASQADIRAELSTTSVIGHTADPIPDGNGATSPNVFVIAKAVEQSGVVDTVRVNSANSGTLSLSSWSKSGNDFTRQDEVSVSVVAGMQTITDVGLAVNAGEYLGFYGSNLVETQTGIPADDGGWYVGGAGVSSFNDAEPTTSTRLSISFDTMAIGRVTENAAQIALKADKSEITKIQDDLYTVDTVPIGSVGTIPAGTNTLAAGLYALEQNAPKTGTITSFRCNMQTDATVRIMVFDKTGDTFIVAAETTVSAVAGYQAISVDLPIEAGQHVGVQSSGLGVLQGVSDTLGWYGGSGTSSFTDATVSRSSRILFGVDVEYLAPLVGGDTYRPNSVDLPWENMLVVGMGQSLWEGSNGDVTTAVEYDNKGFPAYPTTPNAIADATVANTERSGTRGEWPGLGAASFIRASLLRENNLSFEDLKNTVVVANNAVSGQRIDQINKGTAPFASAVAQAGALAGVTGESGGVLAVTFGQGESDSQAGTDPATYLAALIQLAKDADADLRSASGQTKRIPTVVYQMNGTGRAIGLAHLQASIDSPLIYCAGPMYPYEYYDTLHINAASSRLVGAKHGEVIKKVAIDGDEWEPLRPIDAKVLGNAITLTFSKSGLVLDTTLLPAQTNSGFVVKNAAGTAQTVSAVEVLNGNQVRLTCGTAPASDWTVEYGVAATGRADPFVGKMGNLRDNAGSEVSFDGVPLHNWCVVFDWML
jgi:hypothetical protein